MGALKRPAASAEPTSAGGSAKKVAQRSFDHDLALEPLPLLGPDELRAGGAFVGRLDTSGSLLRYEPAFAGGEAARWLRELQETVAWEQGSIKIFGKVHPEPRLTCYYADAGLKYTYSSRTVEPRPWTECPVIDRIRRRVQEATGEIFNSVLCNRYRSGEDCMGWHADDEKVYGPAPSIASVSIGAARDFDIREKAPGTQKYRVTLDNGSLLLMSGRMQTFWQHSVPRRKRLAEERINLTFRKIVM